MRALSASTRPGRLGVRLRGALALAAGLMLLGSMAPAAVVLSENFNGTTHNTTTPPAGWTNANADAPAGNIWRFFDKATTTRFNATAVSGFTGNYAVLDDDVFGSGAGGAANASITSPVFSLVGFASANVTFNHGFRALTGSSAIVEASTDGIAWTPVLTRTTDTGAFSGFGAPFTVADASVIPATADLTPFVGNATVQVRFRFDDGAANAWAWFWLIDNVVVNGINQSITVGDVTLAEGNAGTTNFDFPVTITPAPVGNITIDYAVTHGGTNAADFTGATSGTFTFVGDGSTTVRNLTIPVGGDVFPESNEAFTLTLSNQSAGDLVDGVAAGSITDDDFVCGAVEDFATATQTAGPAGWTVTNNDIGLTVWEFGHPTSYDGGTVSSIVTAAPLVSRFALINSDAINETCDSDLRSPSMNFSSAAYVQVKFDEVYRGITGCTATLEVSTNGGTSWDVIGATRTTANVGNPTTGAPASTVVDASAFAAGQASVMFRWHYVGDFSWWWVVDNVQFCTGTLPPGTSLVSIGNASAAEGAGTLNIPISVNPANAANIDVNYTITPGTATNPADFTTPLTGTVTVVAPATSSSIPVALVDDAAFESSKSFSIAITSLAGGASTIGTGTATGTITNDDVPADTGFGYEASLDTFSFVGLSSGAPTTVSSPTPIFPLGGDFNGTATVYHLGRQAALSTVDPMTGVETAGPAITGLPANHLVVSMSHNPADGEMWAATLDASTFTDSSIGTLNLTTGAYTNVSGILTNVVGVALAHDQAGVAYLVDALVAAPFSMTLNSYTAPSTLTPIGSGLGAGFDSLFFLEADFDPLTNILYMPITNTDTAGTPTDSAFYMIDTTTGLATMVGSPYAATINYTSFGVMRSDAAAVTNWESH